MVNFDKCELDAFHSYGGSDKKLCRIYNNEPYMLKIADKIKDKNGMATSYSNSIYSEFLCCHILEILNIDVQKTVLGTVTTKSQTTGKLEIKPVVGCKNFLNDNCNLIEFATVENDALEEKITKIPKLKDINHIFKNDCSNYLRDKDFREKAEERYWDTFIIDSYFGNFDRHHHNWGYIVEKLSNNKMNISLAPIYDCGSCLYPQLSEEYIEVVLNSEEEINDRIFKFPTAALMLDNGNKVNYHDFINSLENDDCNKALLRIYPLILEHQEEIHTFIQEQDFLSPLRKKFYETMLDKRLEKILEPAYEKMMEINREEEYNLD